MLARALRLPASPGNSFFLWGPRQTGKSTLLRATYPGATWIDLLKSDEFARYTERPALLREEMTATPDSRLVVVDEVQKVPGLLDEIHWLIENRGIVFALCGSSARKVRRQHANLLGGRAERYELAGLVSAELKDEFDLDRMLNHGTLPRHYLSESPGRLLKAYVGDYLREEVAAEGLVRRLPAFAGFLQAAALADGEMVNFSTIARDCGVSGPTVAEYFRILEDTLLGKFVPSFTHRPKRRVIRAPKFYFADVGVVNVLARRGRLERGGELFGKAFENWILHELWSAARYHDWDREISYWKLAGGTEVDFIVGDMELAVEAKATGRVTSDHLKGLRELAVDHPGVRRWIVCLEQKERVTDDGIRILPYARFTELVWSARPREGHRPREGQVSTL